MVTVSIRSKSGEKETLEGLLLEGLMEEKRRIIFALDKADIVIKETKRNMDILRLLLSKNSIKAK